MSTRYSLLLATVALLLGGVGSARAQFPRVVVIEEFTSVNCKPCVAAGHNIDEVIAASPNSVVAIRNQVKFFPPTNPYSTEESEGRKSYYEVLGLPAGFLNGGTLDVGNRNEVLARVEDALPVTAPLKLDVTQIPEGGMMRVNVVVTSAGQPFNDGNHRIHVVALEREITDSSLSQIPNYNGEATLYDVMRTMVTGLDGEEFSIADNDSKTLVYHYTPGSGWQGGRMYAVAFVQNTTTREVVQAGFSARPPVATVLPTALPAGYAFGEPAPNPADASTLLHFTLGAPSSARLFLHDMTGRLVRSVDLGRRESGDQEVRLDLDGMASGAYTCTVEAGEVRMTRSLVIR